jgi:hypothetical protein
MSALEALGIASLVFVAVFTFRTACAGGDPRAAIIEAWINLVIGFTINFAANLVIIPMMSEGGHFSLATNLWGGWVYTAISIVRQYAIRRWFQQRIHMAAEKLGHLR